MHHKQLEETCENILIQPNSTGHIVGAVLLDNELQTKMKWSFNTVLYKRDQVHTFSTESKNDYDMQQFGQDVQILDKNQVRTRSTS